MTQKFVLVIGGAASGKSAFAESLIVQSGLSRFYIATSRIWDDEMQAKVDRHKELRGAGWYTDEEPLTPERHLLARSNEEAVLLDCASMWLTNHMIDETDLPHAETALLEALSVSEAYRVVVTNEVGHGIVPEGALSRRFREAQGRLNQSLAAEADTVVQVIAGLPLVLKGEL